MCVRRYEDNWGRTEGEADGAGCAGGAVVQCNLHRMESDLEESCG